MLQQLEPSSLKEGHGRTRAGGSLAVLGSFREDAAGPAPLLHAQFVSELYCSSCYDMGMHV